MPRVRGWGTLGGQATPDRHQAAPRRRPVMTPTNAHRKVYDLLTNKHPHGLTREDLAAHSGLSDRTMRKTIEELRTIAANGTLGKPTVIGYDPERGVYAAAQSREQAERITAYYRSYVHPMLEALRAQER